MIYEIFLHNEPIPEHRELIIKNSNGTVILAKVIIQIRSGEKREIDSGRWTHIKVKRRMTSLQIMEYGAGNLKYNQATDTFEAIGDRKYMNVNPLDGVGRGLSDG